MVPNAMIYEPVTDVAALVAWAEEALQDDPVTNDWSWEDWIAWLARCPLKEALGDGG